MNGFELAQRLRADPQYSEMAIIMLSSVGQSEKTAHLQDMGIARCLTKPVKQSNLLNAILSLKGLVTQPVETLAPILGTTPLHVLLAEDGLINQKVATKLLEQREPEQRQHIFESFSQVDSSISRRFGGTGLGLAISSQLVGMMGGEMSIESTVGVGTTFNFSLVLKRQQETSTSRPRSWRSRGYRSAAATECLQTAGSGSGIPAAVR